MSAGLVHKQEATAVYLFLVDVPLNLTDGVIRPDPAETSFRDVGVFLEILDNILCPSPLKRL